MSLHEGVIVFMALTLLASSWALIKTQDALTDARRELDEAYDHLADEIRERVIRQRGPSC